MSVGAHTFELEYVYKDSPNFQAIPTFGIIPFFSSAVIRYYVEIFSNYRHGKAMLAEHYLKICSYPLPKSGTLQSSSKLIDVINKGKAAIAVTGYTTYYIETSKVAFYNEVSLYISGAGGFDP